MTERKILTREALVKLVKEERAYELRNKVHNMLIDAFTRFAEKARNETVAPTLILGQNLTLPEFLKMRSDLLNQWGYKETDLMTFHPQDEHSAEYGITLCIPEEAFKYE